jgi:hypothetical protein
VTPDGPVRVEGIADLRRGLRKIDPELAKEFRGSILPIAEKVAADARSRVPSKSGRAAASIRGGVSGNNAYVQGGKKSVPYFGWLDFGARTPQTGRPRSVGPWAKSGPGLSKGRFIYPAIGANRDAIEKQAVEAIDAIIERVLPE